MSQILGECPYCDNGSIFYKVTSINNRKTKIYSCSNNKITRSPDDESWEQAEESKCTFKIFGNTLQRYGKKFIGPKEVRKMLQGDELIAHLYSFRTKKEYQKYISLDHQYGVKVLWEIDVESD